MFPIMLEQINTHPPYPSRRLAHCTFDPVFLLDLTLIVIAVIFKILLEQGVQRIAHHIGFHLTALVNNAHRRPVFNGFINLILVNVAPKGLIHLLGFKQRCAGKTYFGCVGQGGVNRHGQVAELGAMRLIGQHNNLVAGVQVGKVSLLLGVLKLLHHGRHNVGRIPL